MEETIGGARGWSQIVVAVAVVSLTLLTLGFLSRGNTFCRKRYPPGPKGIPILGSLLALGSLPHQALHKLAQQYGPLMFMHLGSVPTLVVSNKEMAEFIFKTNDQIMASRPDLVVGYKIYYNVTDIGLAPYGPYWRYARKICTLELFTAQRISQFQAMRQREVLTMLHSVLEKSQQGNVVVMNEYLSNLAANNITQMMLNKSYCFAKGSSKSTDGEGNSFLEIVREMFDLLGVFNLSDYIPILKSFDLQGYSKRMDAVHEKMDKFLETVLEEQRKESLAGKRETSTKNFVDVLLAVPKGSEVEEGLSMDAIKSILTEMINAGTDTSATALEWSLTELVRRPDLLKRAQKELDSVVGTQRLVDEADIPKLKFIGAVIKEAFRLHPPAPLLVPHQSTHDCEIAGYHIPRGSRVLVNVWSVQRDPLVYDRPLEFDPDRFLHSAKDVKGKDFDLLPFGSGRRICPGLNLGLLMVQYPLAQMLHALNWALPEGQKPEELDMSESFGMVCPKAIPLGVSVKPRLPTNVLYPPQA